MTDRSKRGHEVSQLEGQAITHRHPPVSPSDTERRENDAHSQPVVGSALLPRDIDVPIVLSRRTSPHPIQRATAAAVVCPRDQLSMPAEEGIGRDQGVPVTEYPSPEARGLCGQAPALGVGEPETARTELLSEDAILFLERVNDVTLLLVDPARDGHDEELQHLGKRRHTGRA